MSEAGYKKLVVWQKSDELVKFIYQTTRNFPKDETYGLTSQLRRSALSIPTNIVEGYARKSKNELKQFLNIAWGSFVETEYLIDFALHQAYFRESDHKILTSLLKEVGSLLWSFTKSLRP